MTAYHLSILFLHIKKPSGTLPKGFIFIIKSIMYYYSPDPQSQRYAALDAADAAEEIVDAMLDLQLSRIK